MVIFSVKIDDGKLRQRLLQSWILSLVLALGCFSLRAETHYRSHISVGAHGGMAISRMSFSPEIPQAWLMGPQFGLQIRYAEEKLVGVVAELNFVTRGWKENFEENKDLQYSRSLNYISLPIMTHISFGSPRVKCIINLGPEIGYMLSDKITSNFDYANPPEGLLPSTRRVNQMSMKISNRFDYGITAGLGAEFYVSPRNSIYLEGRFYYGLGNIYPSTKADEFSASRSMSITVNAGYNFRLK